ncbi:uncharacterized protein LOC111128862 [Crassostrea virginica]
MLGKPILIQTVLLAIVPVVLCAPIRTLMKDQEETDISNTLHRVVLCPLSTWAREITALSKCGNTSFYHCLPNSEGGFVEFCNESSTWIEKGGFLEFSTATNATILKPCSTGMYQPNGRWSNESTPFCTKKMSACDGIGEVVCDDGNVTCDRRCRCDNADDWAMESYIQENPLNTSCVLPSQNNFVCVKFKCPPGQELDPSYKCVNKCQDGYHRPSGSFLCLPFTGNRTSTENVTVSFTQKPDTLKERSSKSRPVVHITKEQVIMVFPIAVAIVVGVSACSILMSKCKKDSSTEKQLQNLAKKKMYERSAKKKHRRKLERRKRRQEKKAKLQVKVDKALQKMEERQRRRKEKKQLLEQSQNQNEAASGDAEDLNHVKKKCDHFTP